MLNLICGMLLGGLALADAKPANKADTFRLEPGYTLFFNGKDLTGWKLRKGKTALDGKTATAKDRFQVKDGKIIIDGKSRGNMVIDTAREFRGDVHIKFEFMPGKGCNNDLYFRGLKFDIKPKGVKNLKLGAWHVFEIIVKGKKVSFVCNGETQREQNARNDSSPLGIRAEFGKIQFRRMRFK